MSSLQVGVVADIVIQLLGRPGIDVAMVTSLEPEDDSTDRLMLTSLENDLAVIDWRSVEQTAASLQVLNVRATRAPHALDPDAPPIFPGTRKLYGIDLRSGYRANQVVDELTKLLEQRQVVTVSLLGLGGPVKREPQPTTKPLDTSTNLATESSQSLEPTMQNVARETHAPNDRKMPDTATQAKSSRDDASLDDLVDNLNLFD